MLNAKRTCRVIGRDSASHFSSFESYENDPKARKNTPNEQCPKDNSN